MKNKNEEQGIPFDWFDKFMFGFIIFAYSVIFLLFCLLAFVFITA